MNRFLLPGYIINTLKLKSQQWLNTIAFGNSPYIHFKDKVEFKSSPEYTLKQLPIYHALSYFNYDEAAIFHNGNRTITQDLILALTFYNSYVIKGESKAEFLERVESIIAKGEQQDNLLFFRINRDSKHFDIKAPYHSCIIQGKAISLLIRAYWVSKDDKYLHLAIESAKAALLGLNLGGTIRNLDSGVWAEEYPTADASMVMNGSGFFLIGLAELIQETNDNSLQESFNYLLTTYLSWLPYYKIGDKYLYSMYRWSFCNVHYTGIQKFLYEHLFEITHVDTFKEIAEDMDNATNWATFQKIIGK